MQRIICTALLASIASSAAAHEHNHVTVDTIAGNPGDRILIEAGYYAAEADFSISPEGVLLHKGAAAVYHAETAAPAPLDSWLACDLLLLTSDYFASTGRLDGGDFAWEIVGIAPVATDVRHEPVLTWAFNGYEAFSDAPTREGRSFMVGVGGHPHGQFFAINHSGEFDVTVVAWDRNGRYLDSDPLTFRVHAAPPACVGDFNGDDLVDTADLVSFLGSFGTGGHDLPQDLNADEIVDTADLVMFLGRFGQPC